VKSKDLKESSGGEKREKDAGEGKGRLAAKTREEQKTGVCVEEQRKKQGKCREKVKIRCQGRVKKGGGFP